MDSKSIILIVSEFTRLAQLVENIWEELNKLIASLRSKPEP
jgi:hypothetical protein